MKKNKKILCLIMTVVLLVSSFCSTVYAIPVVGEYAFEIGISEFFQSLAISLGGSYVVENIPDVINVEGGLFNPITVNRDELDNDEYYQQTYNDIYRNMLLTGEVLEWHTAGLFVEVTNIDGTVIDTSLMEIDGTSALKPQMADIVPFPNGGLSPNPNQDPRNTDKWKRIKLTLEKYLTNGFALGVNDTLIVNNVMTCARYALAYMAIDGVNYNGWWNYNGTSFKPNVALKNNIYFNDSVLGMQLTLENALDPPLAFPSGFGQGLQYWDAIYNSDWGLEQVLTKNKYIYYNPVRQHFDTRNARLIIMSSDVNGLTTTRTGQGFVYFDNNVSGIVLGSDSFGTWSVVKTFGENVLNNYYIPKNGEVLTNFDIQGLIWGSISNVISLKGFQQNNQLVDFPNSIPFSDIKKGNSNDWNGLREDMTNTDTLVKQIIDGITSANSIPFTNIENGQNIYPPNYVQNDTVQNLGDDVLTSLKNLPSAIANALSGLFQKVVNAINTAMEFITSGINFVMNTGFNLVVGAINLVIDGINALQDFLQNPLLSIENAVQTIVGYLSSFVNAVMQWFNTALPSNMDLDNAKNRIIRWFPEHFGANPLDVFKIPEKPLEDVTCNFGNRQLVALKLSFMNNFIENNRYIWASIFNLYLVFVLWKIVIDSFRGGDD